jgi:ABC-type polysaccharide/polyol phosphate export permease
MIKGIIQYRDLLFMLVLRDIRVRYKQAAMGFLWAVFMPIVAIAAGILIKKAMAVASGQSMDLKGIVSISVKVLPWTFFVSAIKFSVQSLLGNSNLVTKIYFPRAVLPLASILACLFDFSIAILILTILLTIAQIGASIYLLWLPVLFFFVVLFTFGLGLLLSSANLFFRDVKYIVEIILMFGIFFTPVFYEASMFGEWQSLILLNPIGSLLENINHVVVHHQAPDLYWLGYAALCSVLVFMVGVRVFEKYEPYFAENI